MRLCTSSKKTIAKKVGNYIVRRSLPALVKKATASAIDVAELHRELVSDATQEEIADLAAQIAEDRLKGFGEAKKSVAEFKKLLSFNRY